MDKSTYLELPAFQDMMNPILQALVQLGGTARTKELDKEAAKILSLSKEQMGILHKTTKQPEYAYRMGWAKSYLKTYGLINNESYGIWSFTDKFEENNYCVDPQEVMRYMRESMRNSLENPSLNAIESSFAFERYVQSELEHYAQTRGKAFYPSYSIHDNLLDSLRYDADGYLPDGIDELRGPILCEIKFRPRAIHEYIRQLHRHLKNSNAFFDYSWLLILGITLDSKEKAAIERVIEEENLIGIINIWDYDDFSAKISNNIQDMPPEVLSYISNPKAAILEEAIADSNDEFTFEDQNTKRIEKLRELYKKQHITLVLGAGVSIDAGLPDWDTLIQNMNFQLISQKLGEKRLIKKDLEKLLNSVKRADNSSPLLKMRYIRSALEKEYVTTLHEELFARVGSSQKNSKRKLLDTIVRMVQGNDNYTGINHIITYNFDDLLEQKLAKDGVAYNVIADEYDREIENILNIFHVHGYLPEDKNNWRKDMKLVFSEEDYHRVYGNPYCFSSLAQINAFRDERCLFIGCSLTDPNLRRLLDTAVQEEEPRHYAIMRKPMISGKSTTDALVQKYNRIDWSIQDKVYYRMGINVIWFQDFHEIPEILQSICHRT